ncbi:MAG: hypothetical protein AAF570_24825, partial [Bacteroidota bacterium]
MSKLKIEKLLSGMSPAELKEFGNVIDSGRKSRLKKLWKVVNKQVAEGEHLDKHSLYPLVFERAYQTSEDYLLRNEIRLLRETLFDFFRQKQADKEAREGQPSATHTLLRALLERELFQEFEFQYRAALKKAEQTRDHHHLYELSECFFYYSMRQREIKPEVLEELQAVLTDNLAAAKMHYRTRVAINQQCRTVLNSIQALTGVETEAVVVGADAEVEAFSDPVVAFFEAMARGNQTAGKEKIGWGEQAVAAARQVDEGHPDKLLDALSMLALAHYLVRDYPAAHAQFEDALAVAKQHKKRIRIEVLYNHVSTLIKLGRYQEAIDCILERMEEIDNNPRVRHRFKVFHCFCHIFLRQPQQA